MLKQISKLFGSADDKVIKKLTPIVNDVNALESEFEGLTDEQLREKTWEYRTEISQGADPEDLMAEAFALVREAAKRTLGQRHYDVQIMGGAVLQRGQIAEMRTGEGKTLVSTLAAYLNSLDGKGVHLVTVNDYLARRDAQWMGAIFELLDVSVGILQHDVSYAFDTSYENDDLGMEFLRPVERRDAYRADITYGTNNEFGFDYLRDNMVPELDRRVQRPLNYAIVDEVDNILIDEARTPLIISGPSEQSPQEYVRISRVVPSMVREEDFTI
ncbi:MAG: preprotein translocase subunit SecA, partial [Chloroflexi bacterium]|nr:preprotein translocase subunit SecA [Chloroflexota bacterium]